MAPRHRLIDRWRHLPHHRRKLLRPEDGPLADNLRALVQAKRDLGLVQDGRRRVMRRKPMLTNRTLTVSLLCAMTLAFAGAAQAERVARPAARGNAGSVAALRDKV